MEIWFGSHPMRTAVAQSLTVNVVKSYSVIFSIRLTYVIPRLDFYKKATKTKAKFASIFCQIWIYVLNCRKIRLVRQSFQKRIFYEPNLSAYINNSNLKIADSINKKLKREMQINVKYSKTDYKWFSSPFTKITFSFYLIK